MQFRSDLTLSNNLQKENMTKTAKSIKTWSYSNLEM